MINDNLDLYFEALGKANIELADSEKEKEIVLAEMENDDTLLVTLRMHLYTEKEIDSILNSVFLEYSSVIKQNYKSKLNLIYGLGIIDKSLYDAVLKLNNVRNGFAHNLKYGKDNDIYTILKAGLDGDLLQQHEIDVEMKELLNGKELDKDYKIRLLLVIVWLRIKIVSTSMLLKKLDMAKRLQDEVIQELNDLKK